MKRSVLTITLLAIAAFGLLLSGCGGSGISFTPWVGNYGGPVTLDNNKAGVLAISSDSHGIVTGTLTVTGADGTDTNYKFTAGVYNVAGSVTSTGGGFEVSGSVPTMGSFFIRGDLPTDSSAKPYTVITGTGTTYTISLSYIGSLTRS